MITTESGVRPVAGAARCVAFFMAACAAAGAVSAAPAWRPSPEPPAMKQSLAGAGPAQIADEPCSSGSASVAAMVSATLPTASRRRKSAGPRLSPAVTPRGASSRLEPAGPGSASPEKPASADAPVVTSPPDSFFALVRERDRAAARRFYSKYLDVGGLPVVAASVVSDAALLRTHEIVTHLLAGRHDVIAAMVRDGMYLIIIGKDQLYTDMPEYRNAPNAAYLNERVRGTGGKPSSFGEENLLCLPIDRYDDESIGVHEFCHTIDSALASIDPAWTERRNTAFRHALAKGLWKNTYAGSNPAEFWAELCQCYFDCNRPNNWNHGPIARRDQLKVYDPETYELIRTTFHLKPSQDWRYQWLQKLPNVIPPPAQFHTDPYYTKFSWAREFTVVGRDASDTALLKANDTIRKLFAYRHDVLKALIAEGVKLAVLGRNEKLADLPEVRPHAGAANIDLLARTLDYDPGTKLLVVGEENVVADPNDPLVGGSALIRALAKAVYRVTGSRPIDPNWNSRGRDVQQYELRVKRLDAEFGAKVKALYQSALERGLWRGSAATNDPSEYWATGVLAYFDAAGQDAPPNDAPHPIASREALKQYDPALYALVNETMAYDGHVDWRYRADPLLKSVQLLGQVRHLRGDMYDNVVDIPARDNLRQAVELSEAANQPDLSHELKIELPILRSQSGNGVLHVDLEGSFIGEQRIEQS